MTDLQIARQIEEADDLGRFAHVVPWLAREHGIRIVKLTPTDESLESVFSYLVNT